jgi:hypothetical protein
MKKTTKGKTMKNQFDELTKSMAQSVTRRAALKKFGVGLAGMVFVALGRAAKAKANPNADTCLPSGTLWCRNNHDCCSRKCIRKATEGITYCA